MYRAVYGHLPSINPYRQRGDMASTTSTGAQSSHAGGIAGLVGDSGANVANGQITTPSAPGDQEGQVCETLYDILADVDTDADDGRDSSTTKTGEKRSYSDIPSSAVGCSVGDLTKRGKVIGPIVLKLRKAAASRRSREFRQRERTRIPHRKEFLRTKLNMLKKYQQGRLGN